MTEDKQLTQEQQEMHDEKVAREVLNVIYPIIDTISDADDDEDVANQKILKAIQAGEGIVRCARPYASVSVIDVVATCISGQLMGLDADDLHPNSMVRTKIMAFGHALHVNELAAVFTAAFDYAPTTSSNNLCLKMAKLPVEKREE